MKKLLVNCLASLYQKINHLHFLAVYCKKITNFASCKRILYH